MAPDDLRNIRAMSPPVRILELRSVRGTGGGPEKTILLGAAQADPTRFAITVCYLRDRRDDAFGVTERVDASAVDYVEIVERHSLDWEIWPALRRLVAERSIDIVHAHEYKSDLLAWALARACGIVPLATAHGWTGHSARERLFYYPCDKRILARYPRVIAVSTDIKNELIAAGAGPARVTTVLNGIDPRQFQRDRARGADARRALGLTPADLVIGAVGRLEPQKRFDVLIDAFAELHHRHPLLKLVIAGDGSLRDALDAQRHRLGLLESCLLTGHVTDVRPLHEAFDLFVQSSDYEGTPNAVLEAMALETPLVATDVGGTRELVAHGVEGLIVPPGHTAPIVDAIEILLAAPERARAMAVQARRRVEGELSFASRTRRVEAIYEDLATRTRDRSVHHASAPV
jgi:glycosyltransferase involved in cell wall biosynthesis